MSSATASVARRSEIHIDIYDAKVRSAWAARLGVSDAQLRKAVWLVGSRITTVAGHLGVASR
ncbi:DUF3606 domain-containing protein [Methylobacterium nigriterrae]|uniref:DUF3606 domain-containing protein n=1 Tax=Methylobacterium nigriterrae TaxID=3127512 RepID=UPI003013A00B